MPKDTVAAVVPTFNVAEIVKPTLDSLTFCDEVIVVDMNSTDETKQVCTSYPNVKFFTREDYIYGNFNFGMSQASSKWIIRLDSDEVISDKLRASIEEVLQSDDQLDGYKAHCHLFFFGERLRHGFGSAPRATLYKKGFAEYKVKSEHEHLTTKGKWGMLAGHYSHYTNPDIATIIRKFNYYSEKDVERVKDPKPLHPLTLAYRVLRLWQRFYLWPGWLCKDGYLGFVVAGISASTYFMQECKVWEKRMKMNRPSNYKAPHPNAS